MMSIRPARGCLITRAVVDALIKCGFAPLEKSMGVGLLAMSAIDTCARYASTWTYITQAANGHTLGSAPLGYVLFESDWFISAGVFRRPKDNRICVHFIIPLRQTNGSAVSALAERVRTLVDVPVYLKKAPEEVRAAAVARGFRYASRGDEWHPQAAWEDDTYPERELDISVARAILEDPTSEPARKIRRFHRRVQGSTLSWKPLEDSDLGDARAVVAEFFRYKLERHIEISSPEDYINMITAPSPRSEQDLVRELLLCNNEGIALLVMERVGQSRRFGLYCNLSLYRKYRYVSEVVIARAVARALSLDATCINLGGSESEGLDLFKTKFGATAARDDFPWLILSD